jgi:hypothetical protein
LQSGRARRERKGFSELDEGAFRIVCFVEVGEGAGGEIVSRKARRERKVFLATNFTNYPNIFISILIIPAVW